MNKGDGKMYKYFCNNCGNHFENELPLKNHLGLLNDIVCPKCGAYEIYPDTAEGAAQSVDDTIAYENELIAWEG